MGLTKNSVGMSAVDLGFEIHKENINDRVVAIAGNPNVGKSTVFNALTGMHQHTGNWPGKTVTNAQGYCRTDKHSYVLVDIPGTYSLMAHSAEEEVARNFICFGNPDAVVVVCDATCLERNMNLVLQTLEITRRVIVCVNLMDEAKKKGITIDTVALEKKLGVPVIGVCARKKSSLAALICALDALDEKRPRTGAAPSYPPAVEKAVSIIVQALKKSGCGDINKRWLALRLLDGDTKLVDEIKKYIGEDILSDISITQATEAARLELARGGFDCSLLSDAVVSAIIETAERICSSVVRCDNAKYSERDRKIDEILTSKYIGYPVMLILLVLVFWITISLANYPSELLSNVLFLFGDKLSSLLVSISAPEWLKGILIDGVYRVLAWVVSVMLPPMAIFFPLFTLLEDAGFLPRVAYNLDKPFRCCRACGKQALTMCMGFGCNAAGIVGCRIIDSPRERLLAVLTNNFVPCNGRFPTLIAIISMFFVCGTSAAGSSVLSAVLLAAVIASGILATFASTRLLASTLLRGTPSSFILELPPYRRPQIGKVIVRSVLDRTLFVLSRAAAVAAPAGAVIWLFANIDINGDSILRICSDFLEPFARFFGLDGVILMAFILGLPANEIVLPIIIMAYASTGSITELDSLDALRELLVANGWTWITAVSTMLFSLMHWPCSTALITVKKETGSIKWTLVAALLPTVIGLTICFVFTQLSQLFM